MKHFVLIDFYRFVAASAVCFSHLTQYLAPGSFMHEMGKFSWFVDFFFILSGFVIAITYADKCSTRIDILRFLWRRIARLYPLHLLTLTFLVALTFVASFYGYASDNGSRSFGTIPGQLLLTNAWPLDAQPSWNLVEWSISAEWAMYLLFPALMLVYRFAGPWFLIALAAAAFGATEWLFAHDLALVSAIRALPTFVVGVLLALFLKRIDAPTCAVFLGLAAFLVASASVILDGPIPKLMIFALFSVSIILSANTSVKAFNHSALRMLGDASYSIYMLHLIVFMIIFRALPFVYGRKEGYGISVGIGAYLLVVLLSIIVFRIFELPARDFLSGRRIVHKVTV